MKMSEKPSVANKRLMCGFGQVSNTVLRNPDVSLGEKALYAYLSTYADSNNELYVGNTKIVNECNIARSTVQRYLLSLEKKNILRRVYRGHKKSKTIILLK